MMGESDSGKPLMRLEGWQPIETAPKDGTYIDLWVGGKRIPDCYWSFSTWAATGERVPDEGFDCWCSAEGDRHNHGPYPSGIGTQETPTHWMPLQSSAPQGASQIPNT